MKKYILALLCTGTLLSGCEQTKERASQAAANVKAALNTSASFIERYPGATLAWEIDEKGETKLAVRSSSCELLTDNVSGSLAFIGASGGEPKTTELKADKAKGLLMAQGPALDKDVTELRYQLMVDGSPINGAIHLPQEGTKGLVNAAVQSDAIEEEQVGPHGGEITVVAGKRYELAGDEGSGEVRVYALDTSGNVVKDEPEKMQVLVGGPESMVIDLVAREKVEAEGGEGSDEESTEAKDDDKKSETAEQDSQESDQGSGNAKPHFAGLASRWAPGYKISLLVRRDGKSHVTVVGHRKGRALAVGHSRMKQRYWSRRGWRGIGLKLGHRLKGPDGFDKGEIAAKAKREKHGNRGKHLGHDKDKGEHEDKGKHLGQNKDHDNKGKHLGQNKDHDNKGKHLGQNKDHDNKGKHLGQMKEPGAKPTTPTPGNKPGKK